MEVVRSALKEDLLCHQMLPDVDGAKADGTFFYTSSRCSYTRQQLPASSGGTERGNRRKKTSKAHAKANKEAELSLVVYFRAKCLGGFAEPKPSSFAQRENEDDGSTATARRRENAEVSGGSDDGTMGTQQHVFDSSNDDANDDKDAESGSASNPSLPKRFKRALLRFEFQLPDIQLPSIPLPSLPTFSMPSWTATDPQQLQRAEEQLMEGCIYGQAHVAGLNTFMPVHVLKQRKRLLRGKQAKQAVSDFAAAVSDDMRAQPDASVTMMHEEVGTPLSLCGGSVSDQSSFASPESCREGSCCGGTLSTPVDGTRPLLRPPLPCEHREIVVLVHGFGGGSAMWAQNWNAIAAVADVYAFDLPGFARSHREAEAFTDVHNTIHYYCRKFDEWFREMRFDRPVILCGHSFGAYLVAFFAMHLVDAEQQRSGVAAKGDDMAPRSDGKGDPTNVATASSVIKHLVLADPWGVELLPRAFMKNEIKAMSTRDRLITKLFHHFTPLGGLRAAGPIGPKLVPAIRPDLAEGWTGLSRKRFFKYIYHCNAQEPPSGELAFRTCVAYAGHPRVAAGPALRERLPESIALTIMYGSKTMMDAHAGWHMMGDLWKRGHRRCRWVEISDAGHQIFSENAKEFNHEMLKVIRAEEERRRQAVA